MNPRPTFQIEVGGRKIALGERTLIMGVLNVTPDSFSDGGRYFDAAKAIEHGVNLVRAGADWIDIGGESTRPGAKPVTAAEELRRVLPVIEVLRRKLPNTPISIDTTKAAVAEQALHAGAQVVNDISGLRFEAKLADVASHARVPLILMHSRGTPETMQKQPFARDIWRSLLSGLETSIRRAVEAGVKREQIILDPGLGFGKSRLQNFEILAKLKKLHRFHLPVLIGASRKSFVRAITAGEGLDASRIASPGKRRGTTAGKRRPASLSSMSPATGDAAAVVAAILGGAHIVRVHDPTEMLPAVRIADALLAAHR